MFKRFIGRYPPTRTTAKQLVACGSVEAGGVELRFKVSDSVYMVRAIVPPVTSKEDGNGS